MNRFPERFKLLRLEINLSQHQLSAELNIPRTTISSWELGRRAPDLDMLIKLAAFFNVSTDYLLGNSDIKSAVAMEKINSDILSLIRDDHSLADFLGKLSVNNELQKISKQIKDLSAVSLVRLSKVITAIESDKD